MNGFKRIATAAERIKVAMNDAGKRQADLVRETGIDKGALSHYLKGTYEPKQDTIYQLAKALNVDEMWLWGYDCARERKVEQIKSDALTDITLRLMGDPEFFALVESLSKLDEKQINVIQQMLSAFNK